MNSTDNNDFSDFLHSQYKEVKESVNKSLNVSKEKYSDKLLIGEGAQKKVYKVYDHSCSRPVAMAVLKSATVQEEAQFLREGRLTALLEHPNIMPVYENGQTDDGEFYFTMKLVNGETLQTILDKSSRGEKDCPLMNKVGIFLKVCEALAYAHSMGIIHRDLKPENIHVGEFGEVLLSDWGLANLQFENCREEILNDKVLNEIDLKVSLKGLVKGTPGYIAPEILNIKNAYSIQSDIFALGSILHNILCGALPVDTGSAKECLKNTKAGKIEPFKNTDKKIPDGLKAICSKALKADPEKRYLSVEQMINDIKKFQEGFATEAEEAGFLTQLNLFYKRNKRVCNLSIAFIFIIFSVSIVLLNSIREKEKNSKEILQNLVNTYKEKDKLEKELAPVYKKQARELFLDVQLDSALALIDVSTSYDPDDNETKALYGKMLMAKQEFTKASKFLKGLDDKLHNLCIKYSPLKGEERLNHDHLMEFLKELGTTTENDISYIYKNVLIEEFKKTADLNEKIDLLLAELRYRNQNLKQINLDIKIVDGYYHIDLSNNSNLRTIMILEKFGPINVETLNLSNTKVQRLNALKYMKIEKLILKNTPFMSMEDFNNHCRHLDVEGSKTDFSYYLKNKPVEYLNIHKAPFSNFRSLVTLKRLKTLIIDEGILPNETRRKLPADCMIIEK